MRSHHPAHLPSPFGRMVALVSAALVMLLSLAGASPELHAWLHDRHEPAAHTCSHQGHAHAPLTQDEDQSSDTAHTCAVTLFTHGIVYQVVALLAQPCEGILRAVDFRAFERLALAQPRFLHLPPQAPPAV